MKKILSAIAVILCLSFALTSCTKNPGTNNPTVDKSEVKEASQYKLDMLRPSDYSNVRGLSLEPGSYIAIIGRYAHGSYWNEVEAGAKKAVADINAMLGYKGEDKIKLIFVAPKVPDDVNEQVDILDEELDRYPIAVGIAPIDASACKIQFDQAAENGIPIVTFDSRSEYQYIAAHVSVDNIAAAKTAATQLANALENQGEIAVFSRDSVSMTSKDRVQGFLDAMAESYPQVSVVNVYQMDQLEVMQQTIAAERNAALEEGEEGILPEDISQDDVVQYILEKNPNLKGVYATDSDATQLVAGVLSDIQKEDLKFVGFDGGKEQTDLLKKDVLAGLILQNPYGMGYATVVAAARISLGLNNESFVDSGYIWVTKDNMDHVEIKAILY